MSCDNTVIEPQTVLYGEISGYGTTSRVLLEIKQLDFVSYFITKSTLEVAPYPDISPYSTLIGTITITKISLGSDHK